MTKSDQNRSPDGPPTKSLQRLLRFFPPASIEALIRDGVDLQAPEALEAILERAQTTGLQLRTLKKQVVFLREYAACGNVKQSCHVADIARATLYGNWLQQESFVKLFTEAKQDAADVLEAEARRRAVEGVDKPIFYRGAECGVIREYSDQLLMFLLRGHRPDTFRDRADIKVEHTLEDLVAGPGDPPGRARGDGEAGGGARG